MEHNRDARYLLTSRRRRFDFMKLPTEILITLLGEMAAGQLPLFRSLCRAFHNFVTANERPIVFSALMNDKYRTASRLYYRHIYYSRLPQDTLHFADLYQLARRCDSARNSGASACTEASPRSHTYCQKRWCCSGPSLLYHENREEHLSIRHHALSFLGQIPLCSGLRSRSPLCHLLLGTD